MKDLHKTAIQVLEAELTKAKLTWPSIHDGDSSVPQPHPQPILVRRLVNIFSKIALTNLGRC
jgi:hypothetical protein